jgi:hypothetical protein
MASNGFSDAFKSIPQSKFKAAAAKERGTFVRCTAPDGEYRARLTNVRRGKGDEGPYCSFNFALLDDPYKGQQPGEMMGLFPKGKRTLEQAIGGLHWFLQDLGYKTDASWGAAEFESAFAELDKVQPICRISLTKNGNFLNVRVVEVLGSDANANAAGADDEVTSDEGSETTDGNASNEDAYAALEAAYSREDYDSLQVLASEAGSGLDANDFATWEEYWLGVVEELFGT